MQHICESGGTGRRARLRGVWISPYGFKSRFSHHENLFCFSGEVFCNIRTYARLRSVMKKVTIKNRDKKPFATEKLTALGYSVEEITVYVNTVRDYDFIFISDLHILQLSDDVSPSNVETVKSRIELFKTPWGLTSCECWKQLTEVIDECCADGVLLGGDMVDFASSANVKTFKDGLDKVKTPTVFVYADHDICPWWCKNIQQKEIYQMYETLDISSEIQLMEFDDICIVGINNTTSQMSPQADSFMKEIIKKQKPIILLQHVPFNSLVDKTFAERSKEVWQGRVLAWGDGCHYDPDENTSRLHKTVFDNGAIIKEALCGHLHYSFDGYLTDDIHQHVFKETISGSVGVIHIRNNKETEG